MVNGANVVLADVNTSNGLIHVIDKVLTPTTTPNDLPRTAQCTGIHNSLVAAVTQTELLATLQSEGPFTLFAPTDQAFADAGIDLAALNTPEGKATLTDILLYHVHSGSVSAADITEGMKLQMVNGDNATLSLMGQASIDGTNITLADVIGSNGVIHVIDKVLMPPADEVEESGGDGASSSSDEDAESPSAARCALFSSRLARTFFSDFAAPFCCDCIMPVRASTTPGAGDDRSFLA
jgi:uncharacterized surface protein with fasciclin (FAS1) repeats